ncbi:YdcF family protein [Alicyclobacillus fodiniaquatilis]|uniref:YdcF family protein n=1 Tax=Alicyclobacillus fodiniaquatilis TaxID=1661150 RepID=A0ABW4JHC0_9BACL
MKISELDVENLSVDQISRLLFGLSDDGEQGDCIFVFGSKNGYEYRVPKAVELYNAGRAKKILFSGGATWGDQSEPEAIAMKRAAVALGVDAEDILTETESKHTKENVLASLLTLDREFQLQSVRRLLVVTTTFHMRRCYLALNTFMPHWIQYSLCSVDDRTTRSDNWWLNPKGLDRARNEARKVIEYVQIGALIDDEF